MAAQQGIVRVNQQDRTVTFRVEGRGSMTQSLPMRRCAERLIAAGANRIRVDLRDCPYMDSTFMGTLLTIKKTLDRQAGSFSLVMPSAACARIVQQLGLSDVLPAEAVELDPNAQWTDLSSDGTDAASFRQNVTQAHEELARLPGPAGEQFKNVMRCLEQSA